MREMVEMENCIIITQEATFWNGKKFIEEYPEAKRYTAQEAVKAVKEVQGNAYVCMDYGTEEEADIYFHRHEQGEGALSQEQLEKEWSRLGDVCVNNDGLIESEHTINGYTYPVGTDREDIWSWFDGEYKGGIAKLEGLTQ
jgi:hypothetical protein